MKISHSIFKNRIKRFPLFSEKTNICVTYGVPSLLLKDDE